MQLAGITSAHDLKTAQSLFVEKREIFKGISEVSEQHVPEWYHMDRTPTLKNGEVTSVYRHSASLKHSISLESVHESYLKLSNTPKDAVGAHSSYFLKEGISIQARQ